MITGHTLLQMLDQESVLKSWQKSCVMGAPTITLIYTLEIWNPNETFMENRWRRWRLQKTKESGVLVAHPCNPGFFGSWD
jgi:hypothetical protein